MSDTKTLSRVEIKDADKGIVSAVFSTFNVVDKDNDVTLPGAITDGTEVVISSYGHTSWSGALPVGEGVIRTTDTEAILEGKFFMDTQTGRDTFNVVKRLGSKQEWSYSLDDVTAKAGEFDGQQVRFLESIGKVKEVSPVLMGAGENTRTLSVKSAKGESMNMLYKAAIRPHDTATTNRTWDAGAVVDAISNDASVTELRSVYAWVNTGADPETKGAYKFPHHHGVDGPANLRACVAGIAALNGGRGGADVPAGDREGIYNHLAAHLRDADREPPELRSSSDGSLKLHEDLLSVMADVQRVTERTTEVMALRAQKGKSMSPVNVEVVAWMYEDWQRLGRAMRDLLDTPKEAAAVEFARYVALTHTTTKENS